MHRRLHFFLTQRKHIPPNPSLSKPETNSRSGRRLFPWLRSFGASRLMRASASPATAPPSTATPRQPKNLHPNPLLFVKTRAHSTALAVTSHHASAMEKLDRAAASRTGGGGYCDYLSARMLRRSPLGEAMERSPFGISAPRL
jgi:hypothetical protein